MVDAAAREPGPRLRHPAQHGANDRLGPPVDRGWTLAAALIASTIALPILSVMWIATGGDAGTWAHLSSTVLPPALANTLVLTAGTAIGALAIGVSTAWLVTMHRFPGREIVDRLLVLPLAMPLYVAAYAYVDLLDYAGPVQTALRGVFGLTPVQQSWMPDIRSRGGAMLIFSLSLYPYVYLAARASFEQQSICVLEVARTLGRTAGQTFWSVALPLAKPALAAGAALVAMESLNDLGAVQYLGVDTLSASIYATWLQRSSLAGAAQIAVVLMALVAVLMIAERSLRGGGSTQATTGRYRAIPFDEISGWKGWAALGLALAPSLLGFFLPFATLASKAISHFGSAATAKLLTAMMNSLMLASLVSAIAILAALTLAYGRRLGRNAATNVAATIAPLGYALPGAVLAIGVIAPLAAFDNAIDGAMRDAFGISTGLLLSGSLFAVTLALAVRFLAVAVGSVDAGMERISPNLDAAARTLGASGALTLFRVHVPILAPALGAAALLVFVDTLKELPATLLLRPFNFETLATHVYGLTAAEAFEEASLGAVAIVLIGLAPVLWLHKAVSEGRAGSPPKSR